MKLQYYVYVYLDPRREGKYEYNELKFNFEPFYIGKGKGKRKNAHLLESQNRYDTNSHKINRIKNIIDEGIKPIIAVIKEFKIEQDAYDYETYCIRSIGRRDLKTGPLVNLCEEHGKIISLENKLKKSLKMSGEKNPNFGGKMQTPEVRKKMSDIKREQIANGELITPFYVGHHSFHKGKKYEEIYDSDKCVEIKYKQSENMKRLRSTGICSPPPTSEATKQKIRNSKLGAKNYASIKICCISENFKIYDCIRELLDSYPNLNRYYINQILLGKICKKFPNLKLKLI